MYYSKTILEKGTNQVLRLIYEMEVIKSPSERIFYFGMGGHGAGPEPLIKDPAFEKYYRFRETGGQRFQVTPKRLIPIFVLLVAIPSGITWLAYNSQGRYFRGPKRRTEPINETEFKLRD